ncbi:MerR family transcriptional regulator [Fusibacter paucivorans]|uniref:MerR family transcriptional regulator n=1 Tax=Fusibacter paucivorans TaxID=76009 RepID=A0ABS5PR71_9FIRM|nr:MerR family transcriptional regulator [Fusibacter paucivorans]MBS7527645.1 MerR family transcriptional regulator [Fusibacter paucivorans]
MLKIGDFSKLSRISIRMLRHYDEIGLLKPKHIDAGSGYRYYGEDQLTVTNRISALREMGFGLATIGDILTTYSDPERLIDFLTVKESEVKAEAAVIERRLRRLETTIERLRKDGTVMSYQVTLKTLPERYVASVREVIPTYDQEGMLWQKMMTEAGPLNLQMNNPCYSLAIFHDEAYKESDVDVEIQLAVVGEYANTANVVFKKEAPILMASATFNGSYDSISVVNEAVANWVSDNGYAFDGASFCIYHVSPNESQNPDDWVTEVCYPVRKPAL